MTAVSFNRKNVCPLHNRFTDRLRRFCRDRGGNIAWIYALAIVPMTLAAGAAVDFISAVDAKTALQDAIDAATLAGAGADNSSTVANNVFAAEPLSKYGVSGAPTFVVNGDSSFTGSVSATVTTSFLRIAGINTLSVSVTATAKKNSSSTACILVLDKTASQSLLMNSGADIEASTCEVHVASTGSPAAIFNSNTTLNTSKTCIAGNYIIDNGGTHPNLAKSCTVATDPFAGQLPVPSTTSSTCNGGNYNGGNFTMTPGVYCGWYNFNGTNNLTFLPGVYVIKGGGWNVNGGSWTGTGVTFYFADTSKIQFNSGVKATLAAPTSGTYAGILMYEAQGLSTSQFVLDDSKGHTLTGLIYLPSRQLTINSGANMTTDQVTVVVDTLIVNSATWYITPPATKTIAGSLSGSAYLVK
jgi:Flp pilus assembly protein TadG